MKQVLPFFGDDTEIIILNETTKKYIPNLYVLTDEKYSKPIFYYTGQYEDLKKLALFGVKADLDIQKLEELTMLETNEPIFMTLGEFKEKKNSVSYGYHSIAPTKTHILKKVK